MNAWPSLKTLVYDGWIIRFAGGYTKRANSICAIYPSTLDLDQKLDYCEKLYGSMGLPVVYKLTKASYPENLDQRLEERGYKKIAETGFRITELTEDPAYVRPQELKVDEEFTREWIGTLIACSGMSNAERIEVMKQLLSNITQEKICIRINLGDEPVGCGFGVIEDGYMGIYDIVVKPEFRSRGYGRAIMRGLMTEALKKGIHKAYLQVVVGNTFAEKLYTSLGFQEIYRYWYREKVLS